MRLRFVLLPVLLLAFALPGCATLNRIGDVVSTVTSVEVSPKAAIVAANSFNALKATATNYIRLRRCTGSNGPICRDPQVAAIIIPAIDSGTIARDGLIGFYRRNPNGGPLGTQGLYDALLTTNRTLEGIYARYNIRSR